MSFAVLEDGRDQPIQFGISDKNIYIYINERRKCERKWIAELRPRKTLQEVVKYGNKVL
jgi:hypothetical protein